VPALAACVLLVAVTRFGCRSSSSREPLTVACLDREWLPDSNPATGGGSGSLGQNRWISDADLLRFSEDPGIRVRQLPAPEATPDQFAFDRNLLQKAAATPDVYAIDILWSGILSDYLLELNPYFRAEVLSEDSEALENYKVQGKLVASGKAGRDAGESVVVRPSTTIGDKYVEVAQA
jgi:hypothetical protein